MKIKDFCLFPLPPPVLLSQNPQRKPAKKTDQNTPEQSWKNRDNSRNLGTFFKIFHQYLMALRFGIHTVCSVCGRGMRGCAALYLIKTDRLQCRRCIPANERVFQRRSGLILGDCRLPDSFYRPDPLLDSGRDGRPGSQILLICTNGAGRIEMNRNRAAPARSYNENGKKSNIFRSNRRRNGLDRREHVYSSRNREYVF